ncbi:MAG: NAD(+)/NADH kinase [Thermomicrobiales bacterium]
MTRRTGVGAIGMLVHPQNPAARETAARIRARLEADDIPCWEESTRATDLSETHLAATRLLLVLGGDGSLMRAAQLTAPRDIPVVAVSLGRLGFLAELTPENAVEMLPQFLAGNYWLDRRLMLEVTVARADGTTETVLAANDAVVTNPKPSRILDISCAVDDAPVTTFVADAFIVSTPTGSTAYNLAAHGPIVAPWTQTMILTPVAPHLSSIDSLIISSDARVTLVASSREGAVLTSDGQLDIPLVSGDVVHICASPHTLSLARVNPRNHFYATLVSRLIRREQWGTNAPSGV